MFSKTIDLSILLVSPNRYQQ